MAPALDKVWMPAPVRITIRNGTPDREDLIGADVGLFRRNSSNWELHVRGHEGVNLRLSARLADAETDDQAFEMLMALLQLFREEAGHNESLEVWRRRVGTAAIQDAVSGEPRRRSELAGRFQAACEHHCPLPDKSSGPLEVLDSEGGEPLMPAAASG